jgi:hypothetical protein
MIEAMCYTPGGRGFENWWGGWISSICLTLPAALALGFTHPQIEMSTRKKFKNVSGLERDWRLKLTNLPPSVSRLSRQCGIFISQSSRPLRPVTEIALLFWDKCTFLSYLHRSIRGRETLIQLKGREIEIQIFKEQREKKSRDDF